jgi:tripartite-type tricarboxylate transporter receptor subunit TctC
MSARLRTGIVSPDQKEMFAMTLAALLRTVLATALLAFGLDVARAQFPDRPITLIIPFAPGAASDIAARQIAEIVSQNIGQRVVIDNRGGGGGSIGAIAVKEARPDGYTLFMANLGSHGTLPWLVKDLAYDPVKDFRAVTLLWSYPTIMLTVPASSPAKNVADLLALARTKPGGLSYGSQGVGSGGHLLGAMLHKASGLPMVHVPYRGGGPLTVDLIAGRVDFAFGAYLAGSQHYKAGTVRAIAVAATKRWKLMPDLPTMADAGYAGIDQETWFGILAPLGTPDPVVARLNAEFAKAASDPSFLKRMAEDGVEVRTGTPAEFSALIAADGKRWGDIIKSLGIQAGGAN